MQGQSKTTIFVRQLTVKHMIYSTKNFFMFTPVALSPDKYFSALEMKFYTDNLFCTLVDKGRKMVLFFPY